MVNILVTYIDQSQELYKVKEEDELMLTAVACFSMKTVQDNNEIIVVIPWHQIHTVEIGETVEL